MLTDNLEIQTDETEYCNPGESQFHEDNVVDWMLHGIHTSHILKAVEEKRLGRAIELDKYLVGLEKQYLTPEVVNTELLARYEKLKPVIEVLATFIPSLKHQPEIEQLRNPIMRQIIDGPIDPQISTILGKSLNIESEPAIGLLIEFSIVSRLVCLEGNPESRFKLIHMAAKIARDKFVTSNLKLVTIIAYKFTGRGIPLEDLIQEGNIGMIKAVDKFDHRRGFKFSTMAIWWIREQISRAVANNIHIVRIPVHINDSIRKIAQARAKLSQGNGHKPTNAEIAEESGINENKVDYILDAIHREPISLETPIGEGDDDLADCIEDLSIHRPEDETEGVFLKELLNKIVNSLPERDRDVINLRFGLLDGRSRTLEEVGVEIGCTRERIWQIGIKALRAIRADSRIKNLKEYL
jgi:RNA polymerase primary sigma factor